MKIKILESSLDLFLKYGIREMSIQKLVEPLGISTKTFYKYFKNKEDLLAEVMMLSQNRQFEMIKNLDLNVNSSILFFNLWEIAVTKGYDVNKIFYNDLHNYYPELESISDEHNSKRFVKFFIFILQKGIKQGDFREDINPEVVLESVFVLFVAAVRNDHFKDHNLSAKDIMMNIFAVFIRGLCTEKGRQEFEDHLKKNKIT